MLSYGSYSFHVHFCKSKNGYLLIPAAKYDKFCIWTIVDVLNIQKIIFLLFWLIYLHINAFVCKYNYFIGMKNAFLLTNNRLIGFSQPELIVKFS